MAGERQFAVVARLDLAEVIRSRWVLFCLAVQGALACAFVLIGMRESSVIGFTGMGRALMSTSHALVFVLPLFGLLATVQIVNGARESGSLELLMAQPLSRTAWYTAISAVRCAVLVIPLMLVMVGMALTSSILFGQRIPWGFLARGLSVTSALLLCFVGLGLWISTGIRNQTRALVAAIAVWAFSVSLLDYALIGAMLRWQLPARAVFALAVLNPVECSRLALLAAAQPELSSFGPVGFYVANRIGGSGMTAIGIGWPLLVGFAAWAFGLRTFRKSDLI
ncbi:MAG: ABC transporter permease subunit [Planctomycetota bacterium]